MSSVVRNGLRATIALAVLVAGGVGVYAEYRNHQFRNVRGSSSIEFV